MAPIPAPVLAAVVSFIDCPVSLGIGGAAKMRP